MPTLFSPGPSALFAISRTYLNKQSADTRFSYRIAKLAILFAGSLRN